MTTLEESGTAPDSARPASLPTDKHSCYIALGSNLGDRLANLNEAINRLPPEVVPLNISPVYETPPWGYEAQPPFFNQVIHASTMASPVDLLAYLKKIEVLVGRQPTFRNGPRVIDLDILFYDDLILNSPALTIPHPRLSSRAFVLVPLADLNPSLKHPVTGETVAELLARIDTRTIKPVSPE
jgi:2-amino-4-hydroxy-6-hydroxymethyldihydropteridine diphosphokinase